MAVNLTQGAIWKKLLVFAIPLLASSLVQQLYNTVDLLFVGNFIGKSASAAIGASSLMITCLVGFFGGMSVGTGIVTSQFYGSKDRVKLHKAVHNAVALSLIGGAMLMVVGYLFAPIYLKLVNTPESVQASAIGYLQIYFLSIISVVTYNIGAGVLRSIGDSKSPLQAQLVGGLVNAILDYVFIKALNNGIHAVAWATLVSQSVAAVVVLYKLVKLDHSYALCFREIRLDKEILKDVIKYGIPAGVQTLVIVISNIMAQYHINSLGEDAIAAFTAYFKVELIIYLPIVAIGSAIMTFTGQNIGAKQYKRVQEGTRQCVVLGIIMTALLSCFALLFGELLFSAFNKEGAVIELGVQIIHVSFPFYFIYLILQVLGDSLRGAGQVKAPMYIIMVNLCIVRTILLFVIMPIVKDVRGVAVTYPITWALTTICMFIYYKNFQHQLMGKKVILNSMD